MFAAVFSYEVDAGGAAAYTAFLSAHEEEYGRRNRAAARLWRRETDVGRFVAR
ncbi:MAG: hypothetical protein ACRDK0_05780 [Solirubrobacteraceae bacterium]